ncbi:UNVERIFIED_CONTAM: hypothetical protein HDU68_012129 [Siphonaria sp. JEL0065]|nr:hypothetical protein HDU68_012129 [Siphonaria sp. JEL0065]
MTLLTRFVSNNPTPPPGYAIERHLGLVEGGGRSSVACTGFMNAGNCAESAIVQAKHLMMAKAQDLGANGIINVSCSLASTSGDHPLATCLGTAVYFVRATEESDLVALLSNTLAKQTGTLEAQYNLLVKQTAILAKQVELLENMESKLQASFYHDESNGVLVDVEDDGWF